MKQVAETDRLNKCTEKHFVQPDFSQPSNEKWPIMILLRFLWEGTRYVMIPKTQWCILASRFDAAKISIA